jgi:hypothetical protein
MSNWVSLDTRARELLDAARVVLEGPTSTYDGGSSRGVPDSREPTGNGRPTLALIAQRLQDAGDGEELLRAIHWAELQLYRVRYARQHTERADDPERLRERVLRDWVGSSPQEVASFEPVTVVQVCRWRADVRREPTTGRPADTPPATDWSTAEERGLRVEQLRAAYPHLSARALAIKVGVSHPTVLADLSRRRAAG